MLEVEKVFRRRFHCPATHTLRVPGSVELLGGYASVARGLALGVGLDKGLEISVAPRADGRVCLAVGEQEPEHAFWITNLSLKDCPEWVRPVRSVLAALRKRGMSFRGFNAVFHATLPLIASPGSQALVPLGTVLAMRQLQPFRLTDSGLMHPPERDHRGRLPALSAKEKLNVARLCRDASLETEDNPDLLAYVTPLFAKPFTAVLLDHLHETVTHHPMPGTAALVLCQTHPRADDTMLLAETKRAECRDAAKALALRFLRSADLPYIRVNQHRLNDTLFRCAYHIAGEVQRVVASESALQAFDLQQFGRYLFQSHESSRDFFGISSPEIELLYDAARGSGACSGARLVGTGYEGTLVSLVFISAAEEFTRTLSIKYLERTGRVLNSVVSQISGGTL